MNKREVKEKIYKLRKAESYLIQEFIDEIHEDQTKVTKKLFEIGNYILRLQIILEEIRNNET